jgi:hypothetical protein
VAPKLEDPANQPTASSQLDLGDRNSIDAVCALFRCAPTDVYVAVSMVGDRICDVHRFLAMLMEPGREKRAPPSMRLVLPLPGRS